MNQPVDPYRTNGRQTTLWLGMGALLLLVAVIAFGFGSGWFGLAGQRDSGLQKPGGINSALSKPAVSQPTLQDPGAYQPILPKEAKRMPKDVFDWLKHLEETERRRNALSNAQIGALMVQMTYLSLGAGKEALQGLLNGDPDVLDNAGPAKEFQDLTQKHRGEWQELMDFFKSVPPPQECVSTFSAYSECLGETSAMQLEVAEATGKAQESPDAAIAALNAMKGDSKTRVDAPAGETDRLVQEICDKYETRKWFGIARDFGGGSLGQAGGLPNMSTGK